MTSTNFPRVVNPWHEWCFGGPKKDGRFTDTSFVYVLRAPGNLCRIGFSKEPRWRILRHRYESDAPLELICLVRHRRAAALETKLHHYFRALGRKVPSVDECLALGILVRSLKFDEHSRQYEWFYLTDEDVAWLRSKTTEEVDRVDGR